MVALLSDYDTNKNSNIVEYINWVLSEPSVGVHKTVNRIVRTCISLLSSGDSKGVPGWAMVPQIFAWPPAFPPSLLRNFPFKFFWLTYTVDNFRPAIF